MITKRLLILLAVIVGTFSLVFILPRQLGYQPTGIALELPEFVGSWFGRAMEVSEKEKLVLGADTSFARKAYINAGNGANVLTSIVLAGQDMMTGIHRPERCLLAQGWSPGGSALRTINVPGFGPLRATRLLNHKQEPVSASGDPSAPVQLVKIESVCYYWFVGYTDVVATHEERVMQDFQDRVIRGYNQRWGMVMLVAEITGKRQRFGRDEAQTSQLIEDLVKQLAPEILEPSVRRHARLNPLGAAPLQVATAASSWRMPLSHGGR